MSQTVTISDEVWSELAQAARKRRQAPEALVRTLISDYLEAEADESLLGEMRADLNGLEMDEDDAVRFVRQVRRERQSRR